MPLLNRRELQEFAFGTLMFGTATQTAGNCRKLQETAQDTHCELEARVMHEVVAMMAVMVAMM
eukprot:12329336-Alexandrium_andersonii.AAC.1